MILTFGEILLRLSPQMKGEWIKNSTIPTYVGGAELNVAQALANWNLEVEYFSAMPQNALSKEIKEDLEIKKIGTKKIIEIGERIGIYILPQGADLKNAGVIYDRNHSSFSILKKENINWDLLFENVSWLHLSAISPALNQNVADLCVEAAKQASEREIKVSFDLNYRAKLWKYGKNPIEIIPEIVKYCDVLMGNIWAAHTLLGVSLDEKVAQNQVTFEEYVKESEKSSREIKSQFHKVKHIANTFRFDTENGGIQYFATYWNEDGFKVSKAFETEKVVDKVGSGDCFMAGLIYGLVNNFEDQRKINFAAAAAFGKLQEIGDATKQTLQQIENLV